MSGETLTSPEFERAYERPNIEILGKPDVHLHVPEVRDDDAVVEVTDRVYAYSYVEDEEVGTKRVPLAVVTEEVRRRIPFTSVESEVEVSTVRTVVGERVQYTSEVSNTMPFYGIRRAILHSKASRAMREGLSEITNPIRN